MAPVGSAGSKNAYDVATGYIDRNAADIKMGGDTLGLAMEDWVPDDVNCANFVSGCLIAAGQLQMGQGNATARTLADSLGEPQWSSKSLDFSDAEEGDVVLMKTGSQHHIVLFAGRADDGSPLFIGSNNVNGDGSQRITVGGQNPGEFLKVLHFNGGADNTVESAHAAKGTVGGQGSGAVSGHEGSAGVGEVSRPDYNAPDGFQSAATPRGGPVINPGNHNAVIHRDMLEDWLNKALWDQLAKDKSKWEALRKSVSESPNFKQWAANHGISEPTDEALREFFIAQLSDAMNAAGGDPKLGEEIAKKLASDYLEELPATPAAAAGAVEGAAGTTAAPVAPADESGATGGETTGGDAGTTASASASVEDVESSESDDAGFLEAPFATTSLSDLFAQPIPG